MKRGERREGKREEWGWGSEVEKEARKKHFSLFSLHLAQNHHPPTRNNKNNNNIKNIKNNNNRRAASRATTTAPLPSSLSRTTCSSSARVLTLKLANRVFATQN